MKIYRISQRKHGKTLPEMGYQYKRATIYRAVKNGITNINNMDYITLNLKWAKEHAIHMSVTEGEIYVVLTAIADAKDVAEAYNPGEYFFIGNSISSSVVFIPEEKDLYGESE